MIPEEHREDIIRSGLDFIRSLTLAYGSDEGMKLWTAISSNLDSDISGKILFTMLTGDDSTNGVTVYDVAAGTDKINVIKTMRTYTGIGLKEAIADYDNIASNKPVTFKVPLKDKKNFKAAMTALGCRVR